MSEHRSFILTKSECKTKKDYVLLSVVATITVAAQLFLATQVGILAAQIMNL